MTRMTRFAAMIAAPMTLALAAPATAQDYPLVPGDYVQTSGIEIMDGGNYGYAQFLATQWRKTQEFAKSKGWIKDYEILANVNPRHGEPDIFLVTTFSSMPDAREEMRRDDAYRAMMKQTDAEMDAASGDRAKYRKQVGGMLLRQLKFK